MLHLLMNLDIRFGSAFENAQTTYSAAIFGQRSEPEFEDLARRGYFRVVWGRAYMPFDVAQSIKNSPAEDRTALKAFMATRFEQTYSLTDAAKTRDDLTSTASAIENAPDVLHNLTCNSPEWVAARLWDRVLVKGTDMAAALRTWIDRWRLLGSPSVIPGRIWDEAAATGFRETAMDVLGSELSLTGWNEMRTGLVNELSVIGHHMPADCEAFVPSVPTTLVDSAIWLSDRRLERQITWMIDAYQDLFGLLDLLLEDVRDQHLSSAPNKIAKRLFDLSIKSPHLLLGLLRRLRLHPVLLADLALYPPTSALACFLVEQWQPSGGAWDRDLRSRDDQTTKAMASADAIAVLGQFLETGSLLPDEVASLLTWVHRAEATKADAQPGMLATLRGVLTVQSTETLRKIAAFLMRSMPGDGLGTPAFVACLDVIEVGRLADEVDSEVLIIGYAQSVARGEYSLSAEGVTAGGAASLLRAAMRSKSEIFKRFLYPIDVKLKLATDPEENPFTLADSIARSLRVHIRVLSRAIVGWTDGLVPSESVDALIAAVRSAALKHIEKGRVAAFSPMFEANGVSPALERRPIAADLGEALDVLVGDQRERLLAAIIETDEPMLLAKLLASAPRAVRDRIHGRIAELKPEDAGPIRSLTEAEARIDALLSAGLDTAAAKFIEAEPELKTWGNVPGREITRLRSRLRLFLLRGDWTAIDAVKIPQGLSSAERDAANDIIDFFKALSELKRPDGNPEHAENILSGLNRRRPEVPSYAINLLAARISRLLKNDAFAELTGKDAVEAQRLLNDTDTMLPRGAALSDADLNAFNSNKAVLFLASGHPEQAYDLLKPIRSVDLRDNAEAFAAIALARMGRPLEGIALLDRAEQEIGISDVLRAAKAHINSGQPFAVAASISTDVESLQNIKAALFHLSQMDHLRQAEVLHPPPEPFDAFVISHVRSAAASMTSLVPMMNIVDIAASEDDLSSLLRELLRSRLQFLNWSIPDQSKGGFTVKENPGERDLLLQKDSTTLAVIEAVVCERSVAQKNLTFHFKKLLGYAPCRLFFHLTYSFLENPSSILDHLQKTARDDAPTGFKYHGHQDITFTDSRPVGFIARYGVDLGEIKVVFLVLDMQQHLQRNAAKTAKD